MSYLQNLKPSKGARKKIKRVGRGVGSGTGKTSGRGHKGQMARGSGPRPGFEGGQMPIIRAMPKRGFTADGKIKFQIVNLQALTNIKSETGIVSVDELYAAKLIRSKRVPVKILSAGECSSALKLKVHAASRVAIEKIQKAGGSVEIIGKTA